MRSISKLCRALALSACALLASAAQAQADDGCGSLKFGYGPFDYRTESTGRLKVVDEYHFTPDIENLIHGNTASIGQDLEYTLRASPNHHRALIAIIKYAEREQSDTAPRMTLTVECFLRRAVRFQPDDEVVRMLLASYLGRHGKPEEALAQLKYTKEQNKDSAITQYNIGLIYLQMKQYDLALAQAHEAIRLGWTRPDLKSALIKAGQWKDAPEDAEPSPTAPSAPTTASQ